MWDVEYRLSTMNSNVGSKLILVEGLTGSGKSIMAHFIARQLQRNGIPASWVHEGEAPHPILSEMTTSVDVFLAEIRANWVAYSDQVGSSAEIRVLEACFFNNLLEALWAHNLERPRIIRFADELQAFIEPLNPTLVYLVQGDVKDALERNFNRRGSGFRNYVIEFTTSTPIAKARGWEGYEGMVQFWQEFVALTDALFIRFRGRRLKIDNTAGDWETYNQEVLDYLSIPLIPDQNVSRTEALSLVGVYKARESGKDFAVRFDAGELSINLFLNVWTRLVRHAPNVFLAEGWPFVISFEFGEMSGASTLRIGGRDVDYLVLVGTVADKVSA
jgi:hypothetical protein